MIKKLMFFAVLILMSLQACNKSDSHQETVSEKAKQALVAKYPNASNVTWRAKNGYVIAAFSQAARSESSGQLNAWFDNQGEWYMTETDMSYTTLPEAVKTAFAASEYAKWRVEEVDKIERNGTEIIYVIEIEQAEKEMDLYYSPDGILIKEVADVDDNYDYEDYIPSGQNSAIESYINTKYPGARILEIDREREYTEVEILDNATKRELVFKNGNWLRTKTELRVSQVPEATMTVLNNSEYKSYRIDDVDHYTTADSEFYRFDLESSSGDVKIDITLSGVLTVVEVEVDSDDDNYAGSLNSACKEFIATKYPGSRILESEYEKGYLKVDILHENREKDIRFNSSNVWIDTKWDIRENDIPQAVKTAIASSYAQYEIEDTEYVQTPSGDYFRIELENTADSELILRIKADGTII